MERPILHLLCGKIAAGKSTLAASLAAESGTVHIAEDAWLDQLFGTDMVSIQDYVRYSERIRSVLETHVVSLLEAGVSVVLDFPANTVETRAWMRRIVVETSASHQFHVLEVPDEICLERLRARNASGTHPFTVTEQQFHHISKHFVPPTTDEAFNVIIHRID